MNISSAVLRARPGMLDAVRARLTAMPGVEICGECSDGRIVLIIEDPACTSMADACARFRDIDGVIDASLVYEYCDDALPEEPEQ